MARGLDDLRNLSKEIERKKQEAEKHQKLQRMAQQENLSSQAKLKEIKRAKEASNIASTSARARNLIVSIAVGALVVLWAVILKTVGTSGTQKNTATLAQQDIHIIDTSDQQHRDIHKLAADIAASKIDPHDIPWNEAVPQSWRSQSEKKLRALSKGAWSITQISQNKKLGYHEILFAEQSSKSHICLRVTEDIKGKISLVRAY
ncbi:MAG: hypothetical protein JW808_02200 [Victivallales bacterium]|nr:hypothetical protein [Victivallales bacterium]